MGLALAAQDLPDRLALGLGAQVPERHVEGADGADAEAAASGHGRTGIEPLPDALDIARIGTHQHFLQAQSHAVGARRLDGRLGSPGIGIGLADADQTLVGMDFDDQVVLGRAASLGVKIGHQQNQAFDIGDLHGCLFVSLGWDADA